MGLEPMNQQFCRLRHWPLWYLCVKVYQLYVKQKLLSTYILVPLLRFERRELLLLREPTLPICP